MKTNIICGLEILSAQVNILHISSADSRLDSPLLESFFWIYRILKNEKDKEGYKCLE